jgi:hypothetical protein
VLVLSWRKARGVCLSCDKTLLFNYPSLTAVEYNYLVFCLSLLDWVQQQGALILESREGIWFSVRRSSSLGKWTRMDGCMGCKERDSSGAHKPELFLGLWRDSMLFLFMHTHKVLECTVL